MNIVIADAANTPIYQQIYEQIRAQIIRGELPKGAPLPPIRTVALELRISVITVKKAWELLEGEGLIITRVGRGTTVSQVTDKQLENSKADILNGKLARDVRACRSLGISCGEIVEAVKRFCQDD
jgi:GntR family transcriptional regulator